MITIEAILSGEQVKLILDKLSSKDFILGTTTAGWHARTVKNNLQLASDSVVHQELKDLVKNTLKNHPLIQSACLPKVIHSVLFSSYEPGMFYGTHTDNALMGEDFFRSDISFTLFLTSPDSYSGGELVIEGSDREYSYKLDSGEILLYPSSTLHRVEKVTQGVRQVVVGWIQSLVREPSQREILFDLDTARRSIFAKEGKTIEFDLISKSYANLLRQWVD